MSVCLTVRPSLPPSPPLLRASSIAIRHGLWIINFLCEDQELVYNLHQWRVPQLVELITHSYPDFPTKKDIILNIGKVLPDYIPSAALDQDRITRKSHLEVVRSSLR